MTGIISNPDSIFKLYNRKAITNDPFRGNSMKMREDTQKKEAGNTPFIN